MKSRRINSILKFADNVDVVDDDDEAKKEKRNKKRNKKSNKKTIKAKKTRITQNERQNGRQNKREVTRNIENEVVEDKDVEKHPDGFIKLQCSPKHQDNEFTCYSNESLFKLKSLWNARHPDVMVTSNEPREIWESLKQRLKNVCNKESCWLKQNFASSGLDKEMLMYTFAPKSPDDWKKNPNEWLNSIDIENVMKQYEQTYSNFAFLGPSPIDFDVKQMYGECVWEELCKFDLKHYISNGKNKIGIIFNTDPHYKDGSHWIAMFIDVKKKYIFYFDSNGDPAPKEIETLMQKIKHQADGLGIKMEITGNYPKEHQQGNTECGMYTLYFISELLKDHKTPEYFKQHTITDHDMEELRTKFFNQEL